MAKEKGAFIQEKLMPAIGKMQSNTYISSVTQGMMGAMPVLMGAAIFQLVYSIPIPAWENLLHNTGIYDLLTTIVNICNMTDADPGFGKWNRAYGSSDGGSSDP